MRFLRRIWDDIKQGENLDLYLTVLAAIVLAILNLAGFAVSSVVNSFSLAILALLAVAMLGNRLSVGYAFGKLSFRHRTSASQRIFG